MNWFKHDSDATQDAKIKKLLIRHGAVGYAVYFHCLELIAAEVSESNLTFELEHDSEIIADNLHIHGTADRSGIQIVEEIMYHIIELGLFESSNDRIFCFKLLKRMDLSMTSNPCFRKMIVEAKQRHDGVMTNHDDVMRASKPDKPNKQEEEEPRARESVPDPEDTPTRGATPGEPESPSGFPQFQIAGYWFRKFNQPYLPVLLINLPAAFIHIVSYQHLRTDNHQRFFGGGDEMEQFFGVLVVVDLIQLPLCHHDLEYLLHAFHHCM